MPATVTPSDLARIQAACRIIEDDMHDGINTAGRACSPVIALAILVANLRRNIGAGDTYPPREGLDADVEAQMKDWGMIKDELGRPL